MTKELIEEARRLARLTVARNWGDGGITTYEGALREMCKRLADALEATAADRQPSVPGQAANASVTPEWIASQRDQGWPDMHPEDYCHKCGAPNQSWCAASREDWLAATAGWAKETGREGICCVKCFSEMYREQTGSDPIWMLSRAAVPDAATDLSEMRKKVEEAKQNPDDVEWQTFWDRLTEDQIIELLDEVSIARAERDAALAAIERVRAVLSNDELVWSDGSYTNDLVVEVKDVLAALDGAPEPVGLPVEGESE